MKFQIDTYIFVVEVFAVSTVVFGAENRRRNGKSGQRRSHDGGDLHNFILISLLILSKELYRVYFKNLKYPSL